MSQHYSDTPLKSPETTSERETEGLSLSAIQPLQPQTPTTQTPLIIPSTHKTSTGITPPPARKSVIRVATIAALIVVIFSALASVISLNDKGTSFALFQSTFGSSANKKQDTALIASQAATATAILQPGYEYKGAGGLYKDELPPMVFNVTPTVTNNLPTNTDGSLSKGNDAYRNYFTPGQCTDWAYRRFYALHGWHIPWIGNAGDWNNNAYAYTSSGWVISSQPRLYSIIVIEAGVQHAGPVGHVGIVEGINADGTILTSNWNIYAPYQYTEKLYTPGSGISFIWHV